MQEKAKLNKVDDKENAKQHREIKIEITLFLVFLLYFGNYNTGTGNHQQQGELQHIRTYIYIKHVRKV